MSRNPFNPSNAFSEFLRRERERADLVRRALNSHNKMFEQAFLEADRSAKMLETLKRSAEIFRSLDRSAKMFQSLDRSAEVFRALDSSIPDAIKPLKVNIPVFESFTVTEKWRDQFKPLAELLDSSHILSLGISGQTQDGTTLTVTEQILEAHHLIKEIGQADTPEQGATLFKVLLGLIVSIFVQVKDNTYEETSKIGLLTLIPLVWTLFSIVNFILEKPATDLTPAEQQAFSEVRTEIEMLRDELEEIQALGLGASEAYISSLPRAELVRPARIRSEPNGKASIVEKAQVGTSLAVIRSEGRWKLVAYRDPLTSLLSQGWIYGDAVQLLNEPTIEGK